MNAVKVIRAAAVIGLIGTVAGIAWEAHLAQQQRRAQREAERQARQELQQQYNAARRIAGQRMVEEIKKYPDRLNRVARAFVLTTEEVFQLTLPWRDQNDLKATAIVKKSRLDPGQKTVLNSTCMVNTTDGYKKPGHNLRIDIMYTDYMKLLSPGPAARMEYHICFDRQAGIQNLDF